MLAGHEADRRGVGRGRPLPGRQLRRRQLEGVERPVPRRRPRLLPRRRRASVGAVGRPAARQPRHLRPRGARGRSRASTSSPATTASRSTTSSPTTRSTTRPTARSNRDGANDNRSWNCGVEGPTDDPAVERLRNRQVKNFLAVTLLSLGVPMILMGDEVRRTQRGNNNAYCQDNEISWFDWTLLDEARGCASLREAARSPGGCCATSEHERQRVSLNRAAPARRTRPGTASSSNQPDWSDHSHSLAFTRGAARGGALRST